MRLCVHPAAALAALAAAALVAPLAQPAFAQAQPAAAPTAAPAAAPTAAPPSANAAVERAFLQRTAIAAADAACDLFTAGERYALKAGLYQSEDELLRANYAAHRIEEAAAGVRAHAKALGCDHPSVREAAATVRDSYRQFAKTNALDYAGVRGVWRASRVAADKWALSETDKATGAVLGLRNGDRKTGRRLAVALPLDGPPPAAVQLYLRDPGRLDEPWLGSPLGVSRTYIPTPRSMTRVAWASETAEEEDADGNAVQVYYFPAAAIAYIEALDPREAVLVEVTPNPRRADRTPVRLLFEVGDFRAAHCFVLIPQPEGAPGGQG
jgi:hypothetical protein